MRFRNKFGMTLKYQIRSTTDLQKDYFEKVKKWLNKILVIIFSINI